MYYATSISDLQPTCTEEPAPAPFTFSIWPTDKTLAYLFYYLASCPVRLDRVKKDRQLLAPAIAETLRLNSPVQLIPRQLSEDVSVGGIRLPAGARVFCMPGAANRDPSVFRDPARFDIDRRQVTTAFTRQRLGASRIWCRNPRLPWSCVLTDSA